MKDISKILLEEILGGDSLCENNAEITSSELIDQLNVVIKISKYCLKNQYPIAGDKLILY